MNKILIVQIGFGPTYKKRLLHNLKTEDGYDAYDVLILTDDCEYFNEISDKKNMFIVDLDTLRKDYPWSIELEALPEEKRDEVKYAKEILEKGLAFPTLLQRFSFVWDKIYDYDGFIWIDADVTPVKNEEHEKLMINYFSNKVFTANNCDLYGVGTDTPKSKIILSPGNGLHGEQHSQFLLSATKKINEKYQITTEEIKPNFIINDGNFRTFNFPDKTYYKRFFDLTNNIVKDTFDYNTEHDYFMLGNHGFWNRASENILSIVLNLLGGVGVPLNALNTGLIGTNSIIRNGTIMVRCFPEDRFWSWGWETDIEEGSMGFVNKHYEKLKLFYENRGEIWPYNKQKVVVTLTTIPTRLSQEHDLGIKSNLLSLINQEYDGEFEIHLNVPKELKYNNQPYIIPEWIWQLSKDNPKFKIFDNLTDYGPITKIVPTLQRITDGETIIIVCDDDLVYHPKMIQEQVRNQYLYTNFSVGYDGLRAEYPVYNDVRDYFVVSVDRNIEVMYLQHYKTVSYRRKYFEDDFFSDEFMNKSWSDDIVLGAYMTKKNIKKMVTFYRYEEHIKTIEEWSNRGGVITFPCLGHTNHNHYEGCNVYRTEKIDDNGGYFREKGYLK